MKTHISSLPMRQNHRFLQRMHLLSIGAGELDKLYIQTNYLSEKLEEDFLEGSKFYSREYDSCRRYLCPITGVGFSVLSKPKRPKIIYEHQIQINPKETKNYTELMDFLKMIVTEKGLELNQINRVDSSVRFDSEIYLVEWLYYVTYFKWKRRSATYRVEQERGHIRGFSIGRQPFRFQCYLGPKNYFRKYTKLEVQVARHERTEHYLPKDLYDLPSLIDKNPFSSLDFKDIYVSLKKMPLKRRTRYKNLRRDIFRKGFQGARSINSKNRNFIRDYKDFLSPVKVSRYQIDFSRLLYSSYRRGITDWFYPGKYSDDPF